MSKHLLFQALETTRLITRNQTHLQELFGQFWQSERFYFGLVPLRIKPCDDLHQRSRDAKTTQALQYRLIARRPCAQQTSPWKIDMPFVRHAV